MIPLIILAIITIAIVSDAVIKPSIFKYAIMLFSGIFAIIVTFNYYESIAKILYEKEFLPNHIYALSFILIAVIAFIVFKVIGDYAIRSEIKFPGMVSRIGSIVCAFIFAILVAGTFFIFGALLPMPPKYPYARFANKVVLVNQYNDIEPDKPLISADGLATGIFKLISSGSFSSDKSFGVLHTDFLNSCYLNRHKIKDEENQVNAMTGNQAIRISMSDKNTVRKAHTSLRTSEGKSVPQIDGKELYIIKCPFNLKRVENGGTLDNSSKIELLPCQIRILCNDSYEDGLKGNGVAIYPYGYLDENRRFVRSNLTNVLSFEVNKKDNKTNTQDVYLAFFIPEGTEPVALAYKQNFITELPKQPGDEEPTETEEN
ncbi:MAG: CvpA family protein [Sedimentisphaeraceae bacterium JB056]